MPLAKDLLYPSLADERRKHKKKRLVQNPNSYFMDVKCIGNHLPKAHCLVVCCAFYSLQLEGLFCTVRPYFHKL
uniref:40S ribosomal protein S27 n=1 Tax=Poecilia reticulata TaxID=8081 RepID=A0A3P9PAH9_POERE